MFKIDDESGDENAAGLKAKASQASEDESESEESDSNLDMEVDGGQINDKVAIMQEWLFSESLPNFSRNDTIIEYLTDDDSLEYFFKFIVSPFKSIIHHIVSRLSPKTYVIG